jgi:hypothetical protein
MSSGAPSQVEAEIAYYEVDEGHPPHRTVAAARPNRRRQRRDVKSFIQNALSSFKKKQTTFCKEQMKP